MNNKAGCEQYQELIKHSPFPCILTDPNLPDNPIVAANALFVALVGYDLSDIIGRNCRFLAGPATEAEPREKLRDAITAAKPAVVEITNYRRDGTTFRNAVMIAPLFNGSGKLLYFMGSQLEVQAGDLASRARSGASAIAGLSPRQLQVLEYMAHGMRHAEIAKCLGITEKTVKMHRAAVVTRLGCRTSAEAIRIAIEAGL